ncbi:hypothetical protein [Mycolicibacterium phlei]|uniref:Uncharacterized protein n=1 Tax=Mycolicibacterium phlei DSM 43239 = CCUG 21000 TaxID=1226750 RepID=A0A5N5VE26_MYCPH|nr:hypothetical protein [Mycolicibacterium phlei]EID16031.1 hypothetical protein MPHLEI_06127 [Mycolicibacterium phlei RIVM601174]KAB7760038.1 hypothetical protein MPHL21000_01850 [Mycolicibacterium phlei DSM 43239 = CCUG 21000]KXW64156.1 hypothetical protein MPHL43072_06210 [Mycolicibacterium phlei DSM 43072]KXW69090.1 hypothetical protein MPHL43239_01905 [Mycolicibacterium phlei DSM 43239 = CCUG 21000]KXW74482.1 hypothetical protein MPHL43070_00550 [Mycolicibacterium phlei DSM 43070]
MRPWRSSPRSSPVSSANPDVDRARRVFWFGWLAGGAVVALTFRPPEGKDAVVAITWMVFAWIYAYFRTPFIKIGDRIYAFTLAQRGVDPPPDAYGQLLTAAKMWWVAALFSSSVVFVAVNEGMTHPASIGGAALSALLFFGLGRADASEGFPVARRQRIPLAVAAITSIPLLCLPALAYFAGFRAGGGSFAPPQDAESGGAGDG